MSKYPRLDKLLEDVYKDAPERVDLWFAMFCARELIGLVKRIECELEAERCRVRELEEALQWASDQASDRLPDWWCGVLKKNSSASSRITELEEELGVEQARSDQWQIAANRLAENLKYHANSSPGRRPERQALEAYEALKDHAEKRT